MLGVVDLEAAHAALAGLPSDAAPASRIAALNDLAWELRLTQQPRSAELAREALELAREHEDLIGRGRAARTLALLATIRSNIRDSLKLALEAHEAFERAGDKRWRAASLDQLATVHEMFGDIPAALDYAVRAYDLAREIGDRTRQGHALSSLGGLHAAVGEEAKAEDYLVQALALFDELEDRVGSVRVRSRLTRLCLKQGRLNEAERYAERGLDDSRRRELPFGVASSLADLGQIAEERGDLQGASEFYAASAHEFTSEQIRALALDVRIYLARVELKAGHVEKSLSVLEGALLDAEETGLSPYQLRIHELLVDVHEQRGDAATALEHSRRTSALRQTVFNDETRDAVTRLEVRMEVETARRDAEINRLKYVELEQMQAQLVESEKGALLGNLAAGIAHELNTPVGVLQSNLELWAKVVQRLAGLELRDADAARALERVTRALEATRDTSRQALERIAGISNSLQRFVHLDEAELQAVDLVADLESTLTLLELNLPQGVKLQRRLKPVPAFRGRPRQLNQAFMTLLVNACEAVEATGTVRIESRHEADHAVVVVSDDGRGISEEERASLFEVGWSKKGGRARLRMGLSAAQATIHQHGGSLNLDTEVGRGSTFTVRIPL